MSKHKPQVHASARGFQYTLENGYRLSVMFDHGNYCDNQDSWGTEGAISSPNFEVAVFTPDDKFMDLIDDIDDDGDRRVQQVIGWVPAGVLPNLIQRIKYFPNYEPELMGMLKGHVLAFGKFCETAAEEVCKTQ